MGKFNEEQLRTLLEFMRTYPVMLQKRCRANNKPRMDLWKDLAERLNSQGPPYKSEIAWRRSWAKKKFEMGRVKKRRVSVYADLDNLLAKSSELIEEVYSNDEEYEVDVRKPEDPLQIRKNERKTHQLGQDVKHKKLKVEALEKDEETFDSNPNGIMMEESIPAASGLKRRQVKSNNAYGESSSCSSEEPPMADRRKAHRPSPPENSVELFFKSLAMEVNKANLSSEKLFNLEWSVLKVVSEKIKEFSDQTLEVQPKSD